MSYAKLFSSITESSLWSEPLEVRILFVSMLAKADSTGFVEAALPGLARVSNLPIKQVEVALKVLLSPDPHSKNPSNEGRRVVNVPGGWAILNYENYRNRPGEEERREYMREYMKQYRKELRDSKQSVNNVNICKQSPSASASGLPVQEEGTGETVMASSLVITALRDKIGKLYRRTDGVRWNYDEECRLAEIARRPSAVNEWAEIAGYHASLKDRKFFPKSVSRCLEKWDELIDRARQPSSESEPTRELTIMEKDFQIAVKRAKAIADSI